ncbi:hypothetical protein [Deminuibacter soli]|uniref:Uncharacterized protein n=1 Tax=Deminuibacter soli TaxID=2291815 RepID=A0A3E1NFX5_9BACT|nr:hypothetical protein [Deminuibacter soli]RFM26869.1 hypothetical protein DXN05_17940 [Deminuibacter soli]
MQGVDYDWDVPVSDFYLKDFIPTRKQFNRYNGNQTIAILNHFSALYGPVTFDQAHELEDLILNHLPLGTMSEQSAFNWLVNKKGKK